VALVEAPLAVKRGEAVEARDMRRTACYPLIRARR